jgi:hypothetical protein
MRELLPSSKRKTEGNENKGWGAGNEARRGAGVHKQMGDKPTMSTGVMRERG